MRIAIALVAIAGFGLTACDGTTDRVGGQAPGMDEPMQADGPLATAAPQNLAVFVGAECRQTPEARDPAPLGDTGFGASGTPEDGAPGDSGFTADCL